MQPDDRVVPTAKLQHNYLDLPAARVVAVEDDGRLTIEWDGAFPDFERSKGFHAKPEWFKLASEREADRQTAVASMRARKRHRYGRSR